MFAAAAQSALDTERDKRLLIAGGAAVVVLTGAILTTAFLSTQYQPKAEDKTVDVSFRPPPPPPPPAKIENPPPPPPRVKKPSAPRPSEPVVEAPVAAPAAAAAMIAPTEVPKTAPPESSTPVAAIAVAVGGKGDGSGTAVGPSGPSEDDSPAPVEVKAGATGPVNLPEEADPPEPDEDNAAPEYPEAMRTTGQEARVVLKVVVEKNGKVGRIQVLKGDEPFVAAAIAAVKTWRFTPAQLDGQPIAVFLTIPVKFSLRE